MKRDNTRFLPIFRNTPETPDQFLERLNQTSDSDSSSDEEETDNPCEDSDQDKDYILPNENTAESNDSSEDEHETESNATQSRNIIEESTPMPATTENMPVEWKTVSNDFAQKYVIPPIKSGNVLSDLSQDASSLDIFRKLFPRSLINYIAQCTNDRIAIDRKKGKQTMSDTESGEILIILGCSLIMGFNTLPDLASYWSKHKALGNKAIYTAIPRDRAVYLMSKLYFNDPVKPNEPSKTYYIDSVVECLKKTFQSTFSDSSRQSIDESMTKFKGRSSMKQHMPMKPTKSGIKMWQRCDSLTGYTYDFNIYSGKEVNEHHTKSTLGERVVNKLCSTIQESNVVICFDRCFSSVRLFRTISFPAVGTYMKNRVDTPILDSKLTKGESQFAANNYGTLAVKWQDTKEVHLMSNCHKNTIDVVLRKSKGNRLKVSCSDAIAFYNYFMGGVDQCDQNVSKYHFERKSRKWWKKVFYKLLKTTVVNALVIYNELRRSNCTLFTFLVYLSEEMIDAGKKEMIKPYIRKQGQGRPLKRKRSSTSVPDNGRHLPIEGNTRRRCRPCSQNGVKDIRTKILCIECDTPMCMKCFAPYHLGTMNN